MLCASVFPKNVADAVSLIGNAKERGGDLVEIRADRLSAESVREIVQNKKLPVIVTCRPGWEMGEFTGSEEERKRILEAAAAAGADYVDVEWKAEFRISNCKTILSFHSSKLDAVPIQQMKSEKCYALKIAAGVESSEQVLAMTKIAADCDRKIVIPMGQFGEIARSLYRRIGCWLTFVYVDKPTAEGQLSLDEAVSWNISDSEDRQVFAVVGNPVAHSKSPALFNSVFNLLRSKSTYIRLPLSNGELLKEFIDTFGIRGCSVTIPHKESAHRACDWRSEEAEGCRAVNTVLANSVLKGFNTDAIAIRNLIGVKGKRALVFGAGGVARAAVWALTQLGYHVYIWNRTPERAKTLAAEFGQHSISTEEIPANSICDIVVNATSVGMVDGKIPYEGTIGETSIALECVYTSETEFSKYAKSAGAKVVGGSDLFAAQAREQIRLFTGEDVAAELIKGLI